MKKTAASLCLPLSIIFSTSYYSASLPRQWKNGYIIPIHKKESRSKAENYRPVTLTSPVCRSMESIMAYCIRNVYRSHFTKNQFGFLKGKSCTTQLLKTISDWQIDLASKKSVDCVYFDFRKAFDKVVHAKLLYKCKKFGFPEALINWLRSFLSNRTAVVKINESLSDPMSVPSGVPQGTVLGPLLFLVYINDLPNILPNNVECAIFADDLKIYSNCSLSLQAAVDSVEAWSRTWQLPLANDKINVIHIGAANARTIYRVEGSVIVSQDCIRDLGILIDEDLSFKQHIDSIVSKATLRKNQLLKSFSHCSPKTYTKLFTCYVRPILENGSEIFNFSSISRITSLERPQRSFTKTVCKRLNINFGSYCERTEILKLPTLFERRLKIDLNTFFKIIYQKYDFDRSKYLALRTEHTNRPVRPHRFMVKSIVKYKNKEWYFERIRNLVDKIPKEVNNCCELKAILQFISHLKVTDIVNILPDFLLH